MHTRTLHSWNLTPREAIQLQNLFRRRVRSSALRPLIRFVAGADISWEPSTGKGYAGVIVFDWPGLHEVERASAQGLAQFPYVPGLLSFREGPLLLQAFQRLKRTPDLIFFDGHGMAHPRRFGIASHLGLILQRPSIGCAKSCLIGNYRMPNDRHGAYSALRDGRDTIGVALRTKVMTRPVFISVGHRIRLKDAVAWTLACADGTRIPKPTREADRYVDQLRQADLMPTPLSAISYASA